MSEKIIDLNQFDLKRPEKVRWIFTPKNEEILNAIESKSLRKFLSHSEELLRINGIFYEFSTLTQDDYTNWYPYYEKNMKLNGYAVLAPKNLVEENEMKQKIVEAIFFKKNDALVGGGIIVRDGDEMASLAYKASDRISLSNDKNSSLGSVIDFLFFKEMQKKNVRIISGGRSRNAFGVVNSFGHLDYKLRFGYVPVADVESPLLDTVDFAQHDSVCFLGLRGEENILVLLKFKNNQTTQSFDFKRFSNEKLHYQEIEI